jgi:hypothetical protein
MPLEPNEWDAVQILVTDYLVGATDPYRALKSWFPDDVGGWPISQVPRDNAKLLVDLAKDARITEQEPFSIRLLTVLTRVDEIKVSQHLPHLVGLLERLRQEQTQGLTGSDPFTAQVLPGSGEIFIDRSTSRDILRTLVKPPPNRPEPWVLRVVGEERTGKSYTFSFIHHLSSRVDFRPVLVTLDRSSTAADILLDVSLQVAARGEQPSHVDDAVKQIRHWAQWLVKQACDSTGDRPWWLVFDQCNLLDPASDAVDMIAQLSTALQYVTMQAGLRPRLVLLGYGTQLSDLNLPRKAELVDQVTRVSDRHLHDFFARVFQDLDERREPPVRLAEDVLEKYVAVAVQQVIEEAETAVAEGDCFMTAVSEAAHDAVEEYETNPPARQGAEDAHHHHGPVE